MGEARARRKRVDPGPVFDVGFAASTEKAMAHRDADEKLGREWTCQCAACRQTRGYTLSPTPRHPGSRE